MSYFDNERVMYIPLSIDNVDTKKTNYFFSNAKIIEMVVGLVPYFFLLYPLMQGGKLLSILIITIVYLFLYSFYFRFRIMEEGRLRKMLRELDNNKISTLNYFWGINKIGNKDTDNGVIHYERAENKSERGVVVTFNRGSLIAVPDRAYTDFRYAKQEFMKELASHNFDFTWYEIPVKEDEIPTSLVHYFNKMTQMNNQAYKQLLKLQLDINVAYTMGEGIGYRDFILIRNPNFKTLRRFKEIVQNSIDISLSHNSYIVNPRILSKRGVEQFFGHVLMTNTVDSNSIRRNVEYKPFETYAEVVRIIGQDGSDVPLELLDLADFSNSAQGTKSPSLESAISRDKKTYNAQKRDIENRKKTEIKRLKTQRNVDNITDVEYREQLKEIEIRYRNLFKELSANKFTGVNIIREERELERERKQQEVRNKKQLRQKPITNNKPEVHREVVVNTTQENEELLELHRREQDLLADTVTNDNVSLEDLMKRDNELQKLKEQRGLLTDTVVEQDVQEENLSLEDLLRQTREKE